MYTTRKTKTVEGPGPHTNRSEGPKGPTVPVLRAKVSEGQRGLSCI